MKNWKKYLSVVLAILLIAVSTALTAAAVDGPASDDEPVVVENPTEAETDGEDATDGYVAPVDTDTNGDSGSGNWDTSEFSDWDDYAGDGTKVAGSVDVAPLKDADDNNKADYEAAAWNPIQMSQKELKQIQESGDNFDILQAEVEPDETDDGGWMFWLGYGLIALALLFILYFIVATVNARKKAKSDRNNNSGSGGSGDAGGKKPAERRAPVRASERSGGGHYADDYDATSRRGSKANTGEVYIPRRATK